MNKRAITHYLLSAVILAVYGGQVCPFLESMSSITLFGILFSGFLIAYGVRYFFYTKSIHGDLLQWPSGRTFRIDFLLFVTVGVILTIYNFWRYGFPLLSGAKLMVGCATLGFFAAIDLALDHEYRQVTNMLKSGRRFALDSIRTSLTRKFTLFSIAGVVAAVAVMFLIFNKDLNWLTMMGPEALPSARRAVWFEIVFVGGVFLLMLIVVIFSYSRNLRFFFNNETSVLDNVSKGNLDRYVPVFTGDEFGLIATRTNQMIDGLRERNRIKDMFGKFLNPKIADALLSQEEDGLMPGGSRRDLVILMSDIRDFTSASESLTPEQVVADLNQYFSRMVEIVHKNNGIVDKFLGDGMLAYYGLNDPRDAITQALQSAFQMQRAMEDLNNKLTTPFRIGIGLHTGEVIAGKIGSTEKLEFTVIGDVVNTTARLQALSKELDAVILVSGAVHDRLSEEGDNLPWVALGGRMLKGKGQAVEVYGIRQADVSSTSEAFSERP